MTRRRRALSTAATIALVIATSAHVHGADAIATRPVPEEPRPSGVRVGLSSGFAIPVGPTFEGSGDLGDTIVGQLPIRLELGYRIARHFYVGGEVGLGVVLPRACPAGESCSGTAVRIGGVLAYHVLPTRTFDPWLGVGMGFESLNVVRSASEVPLALSARGVELFNLELGADVKLTGRVRIGPVFSATMGRYTTLTINGASTTDFNPVLHEWLSFGVRGSYDL